MFAQGLHTDALIELIRGLKADGVWDKTELICVPRGSEIASLTNLKNSAHIGNNIGGCAFTPFRGFTVSAMGSKFIDSNRPFGGSMTANNNHMWAYSAASSPPGGWFFQGVVGASDPPNGELYIWTQNAATDINTAFNGNQSAAINADTPVGFFGQSRTSSTSLELRINATTATSAVANTYTALPSNVATVGAVSGAFISDCRIQGWGWGSGLNTTELGNLRTRIQTYMTAIGASA